MNLPIVNQQPVEKRIERPGGALDIVSIFPTIQGEGPLVGTPAVFVRLAGCNLSETCKACDTDYTTGRRVMPVQQIMSEVEVAAGSTIRLIVLTGGEPFRQACGLFIVDAIRRGFRVQVETNGTLFDSSLDHIHEQVGPINGDQLMVVCSPKSGSLNPEMMQWIDALKYIVEAGKVDLDGLPIDSLMSGVRSVRPWSSFLGEVYVQPMDSQDEAKNEANRQAAVECCMRWPGRKLCIQTHKLLGLP